MSDDAMLGGEPARFTHDGKEWLFASCDLECELRYQSLHAAWARNQIEAARSLVSPESHAADLDRHVEHVEGNRFAFGGPLSLRFLLSDAGAVEYLALLAAKAGCRAAGKGALDRLRRGDRAAFDRLIRLVLGRDFPNLFGAQEAPSSSPEAATPTPCTTDSSSSSQASPGARAALRSSA